MDTDKRNRFGTLMTEHERRVNDKKIRAYQVMDVKEDHFQQNSKKMDDYIDKTLGNNLNKSVDQTSQNYQSPYHQGKKNEGLGADRQNSLVKAGQSSFQYDQDKNSALQNSKHYNAPSPSKVERVRENHQNDAIKYRANT